MAAAFDGSALIFLIPFNERHDEDLLMRAMVQTFLDKSLCIAEETNHASEDLTLPWTENVHWALAQSRDAGVSLAISWIAPGGPVAACMRVAPHS
jgi:hypothetical protein